jgi:hypothetical protein
MTFSIIIPAYNEEAGIGETLRHMALPSLPDVDVIVVCNGCRDQTAQAARTSAPDARVIESDRPSKALAINRGLDLARYDTVLIVDADVGIDAAALRALAKVLQEDGVLAASPAPMFDLTGVTPLVRQYYSRFTHHSYLATGVGGAGVYGLSAKGLDRLGRLPDIIADDHYVRCAMPLAGQRRVTMAEDGTPVAAVIKPPQNLADLLRTEVRSRRGDQQVHKLCPPSAPRIQPWLARHSAQSSLAFYAVKLLARLLVLLRREKSSSWQPIRDKISGKAKLHLD